MSQIKVSVIRYSRIMLLTLLALIACSAIKSQTITIDNSRLDAGPYGQGSSISVPITLNGCFGINTVFTAYISDANGNFGSPIPIGSFNGNYTTFINGTLPLNLNPGNGYRVEVISSGGVTSSLSNSFKVVANPTPVIAKATTSNLRTLTDQLYFGWCSLSVGNGSLPLTNASSVSATVTTSLRNELSGSVTSPSFSGNSLTLALGTSYYTFTIKADSSNIVSTKSYFLINSTNSLVLATNGEQKGCLPDSISFKVGIDTSNGNIGIASNFPATSYSINWGDGVIDTYTQCQLIAKNGVIDHLYTQTSCTQGSGRFNVIASLINPFFSNINGNCDQPNVNTSARIFYQPKASFTNPPTGCVNKTIIFKNNSTPGQRQNQSVCDSSAIYTWSVGGKLVYTSPNYELNPPLNYVFTKPGTYQIILTVDNGSCNNAADTGYICIDTLPAAAFTIPAHRCLNESFIPVNATPPINCQDLHYYWKVLDSLGTMDNLGNSTVPPGNYSITDVRVAQPTITFFVPGKYKIQLCAIDSCGADCVMHDIQVSGTLSVGFPLASVSYCADSVTIDVSKNPPHRPIYSSQFGYLQSYLWKLSPGASFVSPSVATDSMPVIKFLGYGTDSVKVTFTNNCGVDSASQIIILNQPVTAFAGNDTTLCNNVTSLALNGIYTGPIKSVKWTTTGDGSFAPGPDMATPTYTIGVNDKASGTVKLIFTTTSVTPTICQQTVSDTMVVTILPLNTGKDSSLTICSGTRINYIPASPLNGSTYSWTSPVVANLSGNTAFGSGTITDSLINSESADVSVVYNITPFISKCASIPYSFSVLVKPVPVFTAQVSLDSICTNQTTNIIFTSALASNAINYSWTASVLPAGTITGSASQSNQAVTGIYQTLINTSTSSNGTVTYIINSNGNTGCPGPIDTLNILVFAVPTQANAGGKQILCDAKTFTLTGNKPVVGVGTWSQVPGISQSTVFFNNPHVYNTTISKINAAPDSIRLVWSILNSNNNCPPSTDTFVLLNRPPVTISNPGNDTVICNFTNNQNNSIVLHANTDPSRPYETGIWNLISQPVNGNATFSNTLSPTSGFSYSKSGTYIISWTLSNDAGCTPSTNTIKIIVNDKPVSGTVTSNSNNTCSGNTSSFVLTNYTGNVVKWQFRFQPFIGNNWKDSLIAKDTINFLNVTDTFQVRAIVGSGFVNGCFSQDTSAAFVMNVNPPTEGGHTAADATACYNNNGGTLKLTGNVGSVLNWETSSDNGKSWSLVPNTSDSLTYTNLQQTNWFRADVQSGSCVAVVSDTTKITVLPPLTIANAGTDQYLCALDSTQLNGNTPLAGKGVWHQIAGLPLVISNDSVPNPWIKGLQTNNSYSFEWSISNGVCPASKDTVVILNYPAVVNTIDSFPPYLICSGQSVSLTAKPATGGNGIIHYQWQQSADSITWINMLNDTLATVSFSPPATVYLRRLVTAYCTSLSNAVKVTVQPGINNNSITANQVVCYNTAAKSLTGALPTGGDGNYQYQWQSSIDTGKTWINIPAANTVNYAPGILTQTIQFRRLVSTVLCSGPQSNTSNVVVMTVILNAKASFNYTFDIGCVPFNLASVITGNPNVNDTAYSWYENNTFLGNGINFPGYTLNNGGDSVAIQLKAFNHCTVDSMEQEFYTNPVATPSFTVSDSVGCGPMTVNISNTSINPGLFSFKWNFGNGVTSTSINPPPVTYPPNPNNQDTTYTITLTEFSICNTKTIQKNIIVHAAPQVFFTPDKTVGCSPMAVRFNNTSRGINNTFLWNFGDGFTLTTNQDSLVHHTYHSGFPVTYKASLISTNSCGSDTLSYLISIAPNPIFPDFAVNGTELAGCNPHTVHFINNTSGASSFQWNFGDGNILTTNKGVDTITHVYTQSGIFTTSMVASNNCTDTSAFKNITVFPTPIAAFTATPVTVCIGDSVHYLNQTDTATGYTWTFGDGGSSNLTNPVYLFNAVGTYTTRLISVRQYGGGISCIDSAKTTINKVASLPGLFSISDSVGNCVPYTITFTNKSGVSKLTTWNFGDGIKDTGDIVQHTYTVAGAYIVNMAAIDPGGCTFNASKNILINGPKGSFVYTNGVVCQNNAVFFQAAIANTDSIRWDFGDGTYATSTGSTIYHSYQQSGNFIPAMNLYHGASCILKIPGTDTIKMDILKIGFTVSAQNNCGNSLIAFKDTSYSYFGLTGHSWNFGDGSALNTSISPTHTYTNSNNWPIQLIIQSATGCTDTLQASLPVKVHQSPLASAQADSFGCVNNSVHYHAIVNSADSVILMNWKFSGNIIKTGLATTETYTASGIYASSFVVGTLYGCYDTATVNVTVYPIPNVSIATASNILCLGTSTQLFANGAATYKWSPVNFLSCTTCSNPVADPNSSTAYTVTGFNNFGCSNTDSVNVLVIQPFSLAVLPNDTLCNGQSVRLAASGASLYNWFPATGLDNPAIANPLANPTITTKYQVIGTDNYNCFRDTAFVNVVVGEYPVINLGQDKIASTGTQLQLTPSFINGPINTWNWAPATYLSCSDCEQPFATVENNICYIVTGTNIFGCAATDTICIKAFCESAQVFIPNAFTPDGDGKNDILMVRATGIQLVKSFKIYNRWGQVVFDRANFVPNDPKTGWDGRVNGVIQPSEVYIYTCEVVCDNGTPFVYKGNVAIIK